MNYSTTFQTDPKTIITFIGGGIIRSGSFTSKISIKVDKKQQVKIGKFKKQKCPAYLNDLAACSQNLSSGSYYLENLDEVFVECPSLNYSKERTKTRLRRDRLIGYGLDNILKEDFLFSNQMQ